MSDLGKRMRNRRFRFKPNSEVKLVLESASGARVSLDAENVSLTGVGGWGAAGASVDANLQIGEILPAAKLQFDGQEHALGRVVVRAAQEQNERSWVAISTIDSKPPLEGPLSKFFDADLDDERATHSFELSPERFSLAAFAQGQTPPSADIFSKAHHFNTFMIDWKRTSKFSYMNSRKPSKGARIQLARPRRGGREDYLMMGSNDYLGLAAHPEVCEAAKNAIDAYGFGSTGSPLTTGVTDLHVELSELLARLFAKEKVILFNSGYAANLGIVNGLVQAQDLVVADMISHASIQDAMQMSRGTSRFFKHNNVEHLEKTLNENREGHAGCLVVTEGVFSMDGDVAPVDQIVRLARTRKARVMVDEAHSFGVIGPRGLGACEKFGVLNQVDVVMGTFSKICGGIGGFVATTEDVANWLYFWARAHIVFGVDSAFDRGRRDQGACSCSRRTRASSAGCKPTFSTSSAALRASATRCPAEHESAVVPVIVGDEKKLEIMNAVMMDAGVFVIPIVYPAVSKTNARFRFTVMATHTVSDLDYALNVLELAMAKADFKFDPSLVPGQGRKVA